MKGVVFNLFEGFIEENFGYEFWDKVLVAAECENNVYVGPKTYADTEFLNLVVEWMVGNV